MGIKVLKADCSGGSDAYGIKSITPPGIPFVHTDDWWLQLDVQIPDATVVALRANTDYYTGDLVTSAIDGVFFGDGTAPGLTSPIIIGTDDSGSTSTTMTTSAWHTLALHYRASDLTLRWSLDGVEFLSYGGSGNGGTPTDFDFGSRYAFDVVGEIYYVDNIRFGTTGPGSFDLFCADFEDGTLAAFDSTVGAVSVVDDPLGTGGPTGPCGALPDFTLSASPSPVVFTSPGTELSTVTVGEVTSPESVTLSLDTTGLPPGVTATLSPLVVTTPDTATLTVVSVSYIACGTYPIVITGTDGTNTHTLTVNVDINGGTFSYDSRPTPASQAGATFEQAGTMKFSQLCVMGGQLYCAWDEAGSPGGPYLAVWTGAAWSVLGGPLETVGYNPADVWLVTDGSNLFIVYAAQFDITQPDCRAAGTITMSPFWVRAWQYDGSGFTDLGAFGLGQWWLTPPTTLLAGPPWALSNNVEGSGDVFVDGGFSLRACASPDQPGACYISFYEDGFQGSTINYWWWRRYSVAGFGTDSLLEDFTPLLAQPDHPVSAGHCSPASCSPSAPIYADIAGGGANLTLYTEPLDLFDPALCTVAAATKIRVWQPGGFLADIDIATEFPPPGGYSFSTHPLAGPRFLSNENGTLRYLTVTAHSGGSSSFITKSSQIASPTTLGDVFNNADCDIGPSSGVGFTPDYIAETSNLFVVALSYSIGGAAGGISQRTNKCPPCFFPGGDDFLSVTSAGIVDSLGYGVIFDDAIWVPGFDDDINVRACVYKLPICRGCGSCCTLVPSGVHIWQRAGRQGPV